MKRGINLIYLVLLSTLLLCTCTKAQAQTSKDYLSWSNLPDLPDPLGRAGVFVGINNDALIIAGGANFPEPVWETDKVWYNDIFVLTKKADEAKVKYKWHLGFELPRPLAYGAAVSSQYGVVCIGGNDSQETVDDVLLIKWDPETQAIGLETLPSLPSPCAYTSASMIGDVIYVAGGSSGKKLETAMKNVWSLDMSKMGNVEEFRWQKLPPWPGVSRAFHIVAAQHNGKEDCLYLMSGRRMSDSNDSQVDFLTDVYEFMPSLYDPDLYDSQTETYSGPTSPWRKRKELPQCVTAGTAMDVGQDHIFVFGGADGSNFDKADDLKDNHPGFPKKIFIYHTITDTWIESDDIPANHVTTNAVRWGSDPVNDPIIIASGEIRPRVRSPKIWSAVCVKNDEIAGYIAQDTMTVSQHDGFRSCEYTYQPQTNTIVKSHDQVETQIQLHMPNDIIGMVPFGQADIALFGADGSVRCFNTITSTVRPLSMIEGFSYDPENPPAGEDIINSLAKANPKFGVINYAVLGVYFLLLLGMGFYFSRMEKGTNDFFLAGQRIPWWAAGISIFATQLSAITFMAVPAKSFSSDWQYFIQNMSILLIATPLTIYFFLPFFRRLNISTAYEYLEKRFDLKIRLISSGIYIFTQLLRMGIVIFLPALALSAITGINIQLCIIIMGVLSTAYTVMGGIEAVIWTDVIQVIVLMGGALICIFIMLFHIGEDIVPMTRDVWQSGKLSLAMPGFDWTRPTWIVVILSLLGTPRSYISDQTVVQRYLTTKDEQETRKSLWINGIVCVPASIIFFALGTLLYLFFKKSPGLLDAGMDNDSVFPWFIISQLPAGISGLLIAGIFAAAMSSLDSSMNSGASAIVNDFILRFKTGVSEHDSLRYSRGLTLIIGIFGTSVAVVMSLYDITSLWDHFTIWLGIVGGGLYAAFLLAAFTKRVNSTGVLSGMIACAIVLFYVRFYTDLHFFLYPVIAILTTSVMAYPVSLMTGGNPATAQGLNIYDVNKKHD